jgi:hypothetical protein
MTNSSVGRLLLERSRDSSESEKTASQSDEDEMVHPDGETTPRAIGNDEGILEGKQSQNTEHSDLYSEESATPGPSRRPPPLPPRGKAHAQYPGKDVIRSPGSETRSTPVELEVGGVFRDLMSLSSELNFIPATAISIRVHEAVDYALKAALEPILQFTYQDVLNDSDQQPASSKIHRSDRFPSPAKDILVECRTKLSNITTILNAAKSASEWDDASQKLLLQRWQELGLQINQLGALVPEGLDLDMNVLLAQVSLSAPPSHSPLSVVGDEEDAVSIASGVRSPSVFSKASYVNQARRRKFPMLQRSSGGPQNGSGPTPAGMVSIRGGDGDRLNLNGLGLPPDLGGALSSGQQDDGRQSTEGAPPPAYSNFNYPPNPQLAHVKREHLSPRAGQLELRVGEWIQVLHGYENENEWFGRSSRGEGWFPAANVELQSSTDDKPPEGQTQEPGSYYDQQQYDGKGARGGEEEKNRFGLNPDDFVRQTASGAGVNQIFVGQTLTIHVNNGSLSGQQSQPPEMEAEPIPVQQQPPQQQQPPPPPADDDSKFMWVLFSILVGLLCISHVSMMILFYLK